MKLRRMPLCTGIPSKGFVVGRFGRAHMPLRFSGAGFKVTKGGYRYEKDKLVDI